MRIGHNAIMLLPNSDVLYIVMWVYTLKWLHCGQIVQSDVTIDQISHCI